MGLKLLNDIRTVLEMESYGFCGIKSSNGTLMSEHNHIARKHLFKQIKLEQSDIDNNNSVYLKNK